MLLLLLLLLLQMMIYYSYRRCRSLLMFVSHAIALQSLFVAALFGTLRLPSQLFFFFFFSLFVSCHREGRQEESDKDEKQESARVWRGSELMCACVCV